MPTPWWSEGGNVVNLFYLDSKKSPLITLSQRKQITLICFHMQEIVNICAAIMVLYACRSYAIDNSIQQQSIDISVDTSAPLSVTANNFLGVNIDAASLYQKTRLDFKDPMLRALACKLSKQRQVGKAWK